MDENWIDRERKLWDDMMGYRAVPVTKHSVSRTDRQALKDYAQAVENQRRRDFARGWRLYAEWVEH